MSPDPGPPRVHGYEVLVRLGSGGLGSVWRARAPGGAEVALKVLEPLRPVEAAVAERLFRREALAGMNLDHPGLVRALDAGRTGDGRPWIAFELAGGPTLAEAIRERGALPEPEVLALARSLAAALDHLHRRGVVHGDVSPGNVILAPGGARLLDLGLARPLSGEEGGPVFATPGFTAPEAAAGEGAAAAADLFSLGMTAAAALLGRPLAPAAGLGDYLRSLEEREWGLPAESCGPGLRAVVDRCLRRRPGDRYRTAAELLLDLEAVRAGEGPLGAAMAAAGVRIGARRRRAAVGWLAAGGIAVAAAALLLRAGSGVEPRGGAAAPAPGAPPPPAASAAPDPALVRVEALRHLLSQEPPDLEAAAALARGIEGARPAGAAAEAFATVRALLEERRETAAEALFAERMRAAAEAGSAGEWKRLLAEWPAALRGTRGEVRAREEMEGVLARGRERYGWVEAGPLASLEERVALWSSGTEEGDRALREEAARLEEGSRDGVMPRWAREGFARTREEVLGPRLAERRAAWREREAEEAWRAVLAETVERAAFEELEVALARLVRDHGETRVGGLLGDLIDRCERAVDRLHAESEGLEGRDWTGYLLDGGRWFGKWSGPASPRWLFAPLEIAAPGGPRREAADLRAVVADPADAAAWLLLEGWPATALAVSEGRGPVPALLRLAPEWTAEDVTPPLRAADEEPGSLWSAVLEAPGKPRARHAVPAARSPARDRALALFLEDRLAAAWQEVREALDADPRDAEMWILDARISAGLSRSLPTLGVAIDALDSAAKAWSLDPSLPAGPATFADLALRFRDRYPGRLAEELRPATIRSCREAVRCGRGTPEIEEFLK